MASVTHRIKSIKQPRGGYINPGELECISLGDSILPGPENIHPSIVGMAVDYLTRFCCGTDRELAFKIPLQGSLCLSKILSTSGASLDAQKTPVENAQKLLNGIQRTLDDDSIINTCKLVTFDVWYRNPVGAVKSKSWKETNPDKDTISNVRTLVNRGLNFFEKYGPVIKEGFTFEPNIRCEEDYQMFVEGKGSYGGYTSTVNTGDGDFLTSDTLWDFKVSKYGPTKEQTLQLLMYWIMGQHSGQEIYKNITKIGIFNPRLNNVYLMNISKVPAKVIEEVEHTVICY